VVVGAAVVVGRVVVVVRGGRRGRVVVGPATVVLGWTTGRVVGVVSVVGTVVCVGVVVDTSGAMRSRVVGGGKVNPPSVEPEGAGAVRPLRVVAGSVGVNVVVPAVLCGGAALVVTRSLLGVVVNPAKIGGGGGSSLDGPPDSDAGWGVSMPSCTFMLESLREGNPSPNTPAPKSTPAPPRISAAFRRCRRSFSAVVSTRGGGGGGGS
jgi:hypothetical protein